MPGLGLSRRAFLQAGVFGATGWTLSNHSVHPAFAWSQPIAEPAPARAVILLWLWGGPSHLETFDPKPDAPIEYRGPFESIATSVPGIRIGELLPKLAQRAHQYAILRTLSHESNDHGIAGTIALTGSKDGAVGLDGATQKNALRPSVGSIVARVAKGRGAGDDQTQLPQYIILGNPLHQGLKRVVGEGGGLLGAAVDPLRLNYTPGRGIEVPNLELPEGVDSDRLRSRWNLLGQLSAAGESLSGQEYERHHALARTLMTDRSALRPLALEEEPDSLRAAYGPHRFGQCCLVARRLVESGTPFVQVNWSTHVEGPEDAGDGGWDMHDRYFAVMQDRHGGILDQALSALLDDLSARGLLESTLVVAVGEFGRTPRINNKAGRDHWNPCYSGLIAGGGVRGGTIVGTSDRHAERPVDRPISPADLWATLLMRLGIGSADLTTLGLVPQGQPVHELFA